jgi:hypothetical protein
VNFLECFIKKYGILFVSYAKASIWACVSITPGNGFCQIIPSASQMQIICLREYHTRKLRSSTPASKWVYRKKNLTVDEFE